MWNNTPIEERTQLAFAKALAKGVGLELGESAEEQVGRSPKPTDVMPPPNDTSKEADKPSENPKIPKVLAAADSGKWIIDIRLSRA